VADEPTCIKRHQQLVFDGLFKAGAKAVMVIHNRCLYALTDAEHYPQLVQLPKTHMRLDYDDETDVLYLHFEDQPGSTRSEMRDDGVILDYKGRRLVGVTILEASQR
jgi:uncharacterized protein YuzE